MKSTLDALQESRLIENELLDATRGGFVKPVVAELFSNEIVNAGRKRGARHCSEEMKKALFDSSILFSARLQVSG